MVVAVNVRDALIEAGAEGLALGAANERDAVSLILDAFLAARTPDGGSALLALLVERGNLRQVGWHAQLPGWGEHAGWTVLPMESTLNLKRAPVYVAVPRNEED